MKREKKAMLDLLKNVRRPKPLYDYLHEIGHIICEFGCCREHCEYEAHGAAKVIAKVLGIDELVDWKDAEERMAFYAGRTAIREGGCSGYEYAEKERKKQKKRRVK